MLNYQRVLCFGNNLAKFMAKYVFAQMTTQVCNQSSFFRFEDRRGVFGFQNIPRTHNHISYIYIYILCHIIMLHVQVRSSVAFCFFPHLFSHSAAVSDRCHPAARYLFLCSYKHQRVARRLAASCSHELRSAR